MVERGMIVCILTQMTRNSGSGPGSGHRIFWHYDKNTILWVNDSCQCTYQFMSVRINTLFGTGAPHINIYELIMSGFNNLLSVVLHEQLMKGL